MLLLLARLTFKGASDERSLRKRTNKKRSNLEKELKLDSRNGKKMYQRDRKMELNGNTKP